MHKVIREVQQGEKVSATPYDFKMQTKSPASLYTSKYLSTCGRGKYFLLHQNVRNHLKCRM